MYVKKIKLLNTGPIERLDIDLPFDGENPKPVILVGPNGSGKSIVLSFIVDGLMSAQQIAYPATPEVESTKFYKIVQATYIKAGTIFSFGKVDFENNISLEEIVSLVTKEKSTQTPMWIVEDDVRSAWSNVEKGETMYFHRIPVDRKKDIRDILSKNCALYFPPNRFEEPAWLNQRDLTTKTEYLFNERLKNRTSRRIITYNALRESQNWFMTVMIDELFRRGKSPTFSIALEILKAALGKKTTLNVPGRRSRGFGLNYDKNKFISDFLQLSTGESSLLNIFLSIARDAYFSESDFSTTEEIRGIVVVDEIDLHLHVIHQREILPKLIKMFPKVQFVITTHSPLFVLGMEEKFGPNGFALYQLPDGNKISSEAFSEFENAYKVFTETRTFRAFESNLQKKVLESTKPLLFMEGATDVKYLENAAKWFDGSEALKKFKIEGAGGSPNLGRIVSWLKKAPATVVSKTVAPKKVVLVYDCDEKKSSNKVTLKNEVEIHILGIPTQSGNPLKKGIENLFKKETLERALQYKEAFIDTTEAYEGKKRAQKISIPEKWEVNDDEKMNLCNWLCANGTEEDFEGFKVIFKEIEGVLKTWQA